MGWIKLGRMTWWSRFWRTNNCCRYSSNAVLGHLVVVKVRAFNNLAVDAVTRRLHVFFVLKSRWHEEYTRGNLLLYRLSMRSSSCGSYSKRMASWCCFGVRLVRYRTIPYHIFLWMKAGGGGLRDRGVTSRWAASKILSKLPFSWLCVWIFGKKGSFRTKCTKWHSCDVMCKYCRKKVRPNCCLLTSSPFLCFCAGCVVLRWCVCFAWHSNFLFENRRNVKKSHRHSN